jgi:hypothetical protein
VTRAAAALLALCACSRTVEVARQSESHDSSQQKWDESVVEDKQSEQKRTETEVREPTVTETVGAWDELVFIEQDGGTASAGLMGSATPPPLLDAGQLVRVVHHPATTRVVTGEVRREVVVDRRAADEVKRADEAQSVAKADSSVEERLKEDTQVGTSFLLHLFLLALGGGAVLLLFVFRKSIPLLRLLPW